MSWHRPHARPAWQTLRFNARSYTQDPLIYNMAMHAQVPYKTFPDTFVPRPVGELDGVYQVSFVAPSMQRVTYSLDVNEQFGLNDECAQMEPSTSINANKSYAYVRCDEAPCVPPARCDSETVNREWILG